MHLVQPYYSDYCTRAPATSDPGEVRLYRERASRERFVRFEFYYSCLSLFYIYSCAVGFKLEYISTSVSIWGSNTTTHPLSTRTLYHTHALRTKPHSQSHDATWRNFLSLAFFHVAGFPQTSCVTPGQIPCLLLRPHFTVCVAETNRNSTQK